MKDPRAKRVLFAGYAPVHFICFLSTYRRLAEDPRVDVYLSGGFREGKKDEWTYRLDGFYDPFPVVEHYDAAGSARGVQVVGTHAYLANGYTGLRILDVSDPSAVRETASLGTYRAVDVHVSGSFAYIADDWAGMRVIDISDPSSPRVVGHSDTPGNAEGPTNG